MKRKRSPIPPAVVSVQTSHKGCTLLQLPRELRVQTSSLSRATGGALENGFGPASKLRPGGREKGRGRKGAREKVILRSLKGKEEGRERGK